MTDNLPARRDEEPEVLEGELVFGKKKCGICGRTFGALNSDEEAREIWEQANPGQEFNVENMTVVCDPCERNMRVQGYGIDYGFGEPKGILGWSGP